MNRRFKVSIMFLAGLLVTLIAVLPIAHAAPGQGVPFQQLQDQVDGLQAQVQALAEQINQGGNQLVEVNCVDNSISGALAQARPGSMLVVTVTGTCTEDVTIARNDVTLQGNSGQVIGQITVEGGQRVTIQGLTITGSGDGVFATRNADVTVRDNVIVNNQGAGVAATFGAFILLEGNTIESNGSPARGFGVVLTNAAHGQLSGNTITSSIPGFNGAVVAAYRGVTLRIVGGNVITHTNFDPNNLNPSHALALNPEHGTTVRQDLPGGAAVPDQVHGNIFINNTTNVDVRDVDILGNVEAQIHSVFRPRDNSRDVTVTGNIRLRQDSAAVFPNPAARVTGQLVCEDEESSFGGSAFFGLPPSDVVQGGIFCSGF